MHTIILPHALAYNADAAPEAMRRIARAIGKENAATGLFDLAAGLGAPMALKDIGMPVEGIEPAIDQIIANPYWNPQPLERRALTNLLSSAHAGLRPSGKNFS